MTDIWAECRGNRQIRALRFDLLRIVESQEQVATMELVNTLDEQTILESLLEATKPPLMSEADQKHYLIVTPFRYPPLPFGSRFGDRTQHGIFYGSLHLATLFAECAYYRFIFYHGMMEEPPEEQMLTQHTVFKVRVRSAHGIRLDEAPFKRYESLLISAVEYSLTNMLGNHMRDAGVKVFSYVSARDPERGVNVGIFHPDTIVNKRPLDLQQWFCTTKKDRVAFRQMHQHQYFDFQLEQFYVSGELPHPSV